MPRNKGIVHTFMRFRETRESPVLTESVKAVSASGDNLVDIALMTYIKDDAIFFAIINTMKCQCQLYRSQVGGQVPAGF